MSDWISVKDDMPECDVYVMTWDGCDLGLDYCDIEVEYGTTFFANDEFGNVTHWLSIHFLPNPPVAED